MPPSTLYLQAMYACQAVVCCYGGFQSYYAITNLQKYEKMSQKLAEWSDTAKEHLNRTRTTQTTGALAVLASFITATTLAIGNPYLPTWLRFSASPTMLVAVLFARGHIKNYWNPQDKKEGGMKVPAVSNLESYNTAQHQTEELLQTLEYLEYGWVATSFIAGMLGKA
ncbi:hypothetical protein LTR17_025878 [Elasticomyces elasticus]|nr:hypothetical protein LTR17_025878 [Elasticomyces elasticus]